MDTYDLIDENDEPLNKTANYNQVHSQGLWHRGVHVVLYTPSKRIVMQKRSPSLAYHPDEVEVSVGGGVNAGETPAQAALREVTEETGLDLHEKDLSYIGKTKWNHSTKTQIIHVFIYSYAARISENATLTQNAEERSQLFLLPEKKLRRALRLHRIKKVGRISGQYAYWRYLLDSID